MVNKAAFEEAGLELPNRDLSYEDLPALAEKFNAGQQAAGHEAVERLFGWSSRA
jgi:multiple sugar transport system substrate-binding protein